MNSTRLKIKDQLRKVVPFVTVFPTEDANHLNNKNLQDKSPQTLKNIVYSRFSKLISANNDHLSGQDDTMGKSQQCPTSGTENVCQVQRG